MKRTILSTVKQDKIYTLSELKCLLPEKQKMFYNAYVIAWNGTQAYKTVYGEDLGDSTAATNASKLLRVTKGKQYIAFIKHDYEMLCGITKARQIKEYSKIAYSSIAYFHETWVKLKEYKQILRANPEALEAVEAVETRTFKVGKKKQKQVKLKLYSKIAALERIDKLMNYETAVKIDVTNETTIKQDLTNLSTDDLIKRAQAIKTIHGTK